MKPTRALLPAVIGVALLTGCSARIVSSEVITESTVTDTASGDVADATKASDIEVGDDLAAVQTIDVSFDEADYQDMLAAYAATGDKEWIEATVTIDGTTYQEVGLRLKGNSSLRSVSTDADPTTLPWLIDLDQFVDGQSHDGLVELVVRSNGTATSLNEAVALELLELAGLASQDAVATAFTVNGGDAVLRLVVDHPDDVWMAEVFDASGALYKAESTGDYSYRGTDPEAYDEVFDQEAGSESTDLTPLIEFLDFVNNADDATFADELAQRLDVEAFATYLAIEELLGNFDDIDGPGNNSYLYYDTDSGQFTVVPWDHNLAFGVGMAGRGGGGAMPAGGGAPPIGDMPTRPGGVGDVPGGGGAGGPMGGSNVLVQRFLAVDEWQQLVDSKVEQLRTELFDSGVASELLQQWADVVAASGLVDDATIAAEVAAIESALR